MHSWPELKTLFIPEAPVKLQQDKEGGQTRELEIRKEGVEKGEKKGEEGREVEEGHPQQEKSDMKTFRSPWMGSKKPRFSWRNS